MKLITFYENGQLLLGVATQRGVLPVKKGDIPMKMEDVIADWDGALAFLKTYIGQEHDASEYLAEDSLHIGPCVPHPGKIIGIGLNYVEYMRFQHAQLPEFPYLFPKFGEAVRGSGESVINPCNSLQLDFESELAVVIGRKARLVKEEQALDYVLGYCCANDISARDFQNMTTSWMPGKCCDTFAPIGPYLVTADEVRDPNNLQVRGWVNGDLRQNFNTSDMIRDVRFLISGISRFFTLNPGDVILTGTSIGHIMLEPEESRRWLKDGDLLEVEIEGLGRLKNVVRNENIDENC